MATPKVRQNRRGTHILHSCGVPAQPHRIKEGWWVSAVAAVNNYGMDLGESEDLPEGAIQIDKFAVGPQGETVIVYEVPRGAERRRVDLPASQAAQAKALQVSKRPSSTLDLIRSQDRPKRHVIPSHPTKAVLAEGRWDDEDATPAVAIFAPEGVAPVCVRSINRVLTDDLPGEIAALPPEIRWLAFPIEDHLTDGDLLGAVARLDAMRGVGAIRASFGMLVLREAKFNSMDTLVQDLGGQDLIVLDEDGEMASGTKVKRPKPIKVAVVVTVHNSLRATMQCLRSMADRDFGGGLDPSVIIVDDDSMPYVSRALAEHCDAHNWQIMRHKERQGYTRTINDGFAAALEHDPEWICAVNSDTVLTDGWLWKMIRAGQSNDQAGMVGCHSNEAVHLNSPAWTLQGDDPNAIAEKLALFSLKRYPEVVTPTGFCLLFKRSVWDEIGPFDESYGEAYGEETDYWGRMVEQGKGIAVLADDVWVWHEGNGSYDPRASAGVKQTAMDLYKQRHHKTHAIAVDRVNMKAIRDVWKRAPRSICGSRPRVCFYLNEYALYGGVLATANICNNLILQGWDARIAAAAVRKDAYMTLPLLTHPMEFKNHADMQNRLAEQFKAPGVLVATVWNSAHKVRELCERTGLTPSYFIQDDEASFRTPDGSRYTAPENVWGSYREIKDIVVNSQWVLDVVNEHGGEHCEYIPVGVDTTLFHPRPRPDTTPTVLMFYRSETAYRGGKMAEQICQNLISQDRNIRIVTFGGRTDSMHYRVEQMGKIPQKTVAELYAEADVFIECSDFQGFGLQGLEAMASGCALISTRNKGIDNYGEDGINCKLVNVGDADKAVTIALDLLSNQHKRQDLIAAGLATAKAFDWSEVARRHGEFYAKLMQ